jgi:urease accessory protein
VPAHAPAESGSASPASGWTDTAVSVRLRRGAGGTVRIEGVLCSAPVWFRWDGATLWLVGSGASPVGEDHIRVRVDVGPGVAVAVRSVAATVVYAARGAGTRWETDLHVADGASIDWRPEPVILTERARHQATTTVHVAAGGRVQLDEVLVLGRAGEATGKLRSSLAVRVDDTPVLLTSIDTSLPGWSGPAGVAGASVVANRLRLGLGEARAVAPTPGGAALLQPAPGCQLAAVTAADVRVARESLDAVLPAIPGRSCSVTRWKHSGSEQEIDSP